MVIGLRDLTFPVSTIRWVNVKLWMNQKDAFWQGVLYSLVNGMDDIVDQVDFGKSRIIDQRLSAFKPLKKN